MDQQIILEEIDDMVEVEHIDVYGFLDGTINKDGTLIFCPQDFLMACLLKVAPVLGT